MLKNLNPHLQDVSDDVISKVKGMRVAMVTNIPAPYRLPVYARIAEEPDMDLCVFFFSEREPDRKWDLEITNFKHIFLTENFISYRGRFIHANLDIWTKLYKFRPDIIVNMGFNPTHLLAYAYARLYGIKHIVMTDGTFQSESKLSLAHRWIRKVVYAGTKAFLGPSEGTFELYRSYGIHPERMFKTHLCANNSAFLSVSPVKKIFDFIFCGRFVATKNPLFAISHRSACLHSSQNMASSILTSLKP